MGERTDADVIHSCGSHFLEAFYAHVSGSLGLDALVSGLYHLDCFSHRLVVHVVKHDDVCARLDRLLHLVKVGSLDFYLDAFGDA